MIEPTGFPLTPSQPLPPPAHTRAPLKALIVLLVVLVGAGLALGGMFVTGNLGPTTSTVQYPKMSGLLLLATAPMTKEGTARWINPTVYDFQRGEFRPVDADKLVAAPDAQNLTYQHVFSGSGDFIAFTGAADVKSSSSLSDIPMQIYRADISKASSYNQFLQLVQSAQMLTKNTGAIKQFPSVSNAGDVLYMEHPPVDNKTLLSSAAESWNIRLLSSDATDRIVAIGIHPQWVDKNRFLFLKNDGMYLFDISTGVPQKVWASQDPVTMNMSLKVSDDARYVAWSAPQAPGVFIFRALNWDTGGLTLKGIIPEAGTYAAFSPDDRYVAVLAPAHSTKSLTAWDTAINIFDVETLQKASPGLTLIGSDPNLTYLTDWRP